MADSDTFDTDLKAAFEPAYVLERELTGGGMSRVFLATERSLNRKVVIKVLPTDVAAGVNRERFRREVQLAAQLQHPHIVPLYSAGEHGDLLFYTMPFIEGESLKHAIQERTKFSPREVVGIMHDIVDALAYAHARGVIHRDIKPGNVLRSGRHAVVTDFGVAKAISASLPAVGTTTSGMAIGTPAYMAPEQLAGDPAADHRMDIYAVGLLAYELLTGEAPFSEPSPQETMAAQLTRDPQPIDRSRADVPPVLAALVMHCLAKNPAHRPSSATELLAALDALAFPSGDYPPRPARPRARAGIVLAGAAVVLLALVLGQRNGAFFAAFQPAKRDVAPVPVIIAAKPAPPAAAPVLTREDSLAIARRVDAQLSDRRERAAEQQSKLDRDMMTKFADSLRASFEKAIFDSLARIRSATLAPAPATIDSIVRAARGAPVIFRFGDPGAGRGRDGPASKAAFDARAANMGPPRRMVVWNHPPERRPGLQESGTAIMDVVRKIAASKRFVPVGRDSTFAVLERTRNRDSVMQTLNADLMVSIRGSVAHADSVFWVITIRDQSAHSAYVQRTVVSPRAPGATPLLYVDSLVSQTTRALEEIDRAPRRRPDGQRGAGTADAAGATSSSAFPPPPFKKP